MAELSNLQVPKKYVKMYEHLARKFKYTNLLLRRHRQCMGNQLQLEPLRIQSRNPERNQSNLHHIHILVRSQPTFAQTEQLCHFQLKHNYALVSFMTQNFRVELLPKYQAASRTPMAPKAQQLPQ